MKRTGNLIGKIAEPENLELAFFKAQKGKAANQAVIAYRKHLAANLSDLRAQILSGEVELGDYGFFTIYDPKERQICAAPFPERVLHHALMNVCHPVFEKQQVYHSYATRKNKGTYAALSRAMDCQQRYSWFLKLDVRKYFDSIDHQVLFGLLQQKFKDRELLQIFKKIISSYQTSQGCGLPIGNLTSQYFANYYLSFADFYIQQELGALGYVRYMDDMVVWSNSKEKLLETEQYISSFLINRLCLSLKISNVNRSAHGLSFLGYKVFPELVKLNNRSKKRFAEKATSYQLKLLNDEWTQATYQRHILPLLAYLSYAKTTGLRKKIFAAP